MQNEGPSPRPDVSTVSVDLSVYSLTAVLKSAYKFTARAYLHLQTEGDSKVSVRVQTKDGTPAEAITGELLNGLLDQRLREIVATETRLERDLVLAHALSRTGLLDARGPPR